MPTIDRALYAFAATMILLAAVGHRVFLSTHPQTSSPSAPIHLHAPDAPPFEGSLMV